MVRDVAREKDVALLWHNEAVAVRMVFAEVKAVVDAQKLLQARTIVSGVLDGTVHGLAFHSICLAVGVPTRALSRWVAGEEVIKKQKQGEEEPAFDIRKRRMQLETEQAILAWFEATDLIQRMVEAWRHDIPGAAGPPNFIWQPLHRNVLWYRGGLIFEAHSLVYHSA